jgi:cytochrome c oxidase cbb3-type subunit III
MSGEPERDPVSGYQTTGHAWNGITELNSPVPRAVWGFMTVTHVVGVAMLILLPAVPLWRSFTPGLLGQDEAQRINAEVAAAAAVRAPWTDVILASDFAAIKADADLMRIVRSTGAPLFGTNCAACHGVLGAGNPGFPRLNDGDWLWGSDPETIHETLRVGINVAHPDTRYAQMPAFGRDELLTRDQIETLIPHVIGLATPGATTTPEATTLFSENCVSCHGEAGKGLIEVGAPNLTDAIWQYGGSTDAIRATLRNGRQGQMPAWEDRLTDAERKLLTLYVLDLGAAK